MSLAKEFKYYLANKDALVKQYSGKVIAIRDEKILGVFDSEILAVEAISKIHPLGTFLVQKCEPGEDANSQTFHSRVLAVA